jgi:hypothetical protein
MGIVMLLKHLLRKLWCYMTYTYENSAQKNQQENMKCFGVLSGNRHALHTSDTTGHPGWVCLDRVAILRAFLYITSSSGTLPPGA